MCVCRLRAHVLRTRSYLGWSRATHCEYSHVASCGLKGRLQTASEDEAGVYQTSVLVAMA